MFGECHAHIFMNGTDYQKAKADYEAGVNRESIHQDIREKLAQYKQMGITFYRDGGDHYGASVYARSIAQEYGIDYRTPVFAIHKNKHYGGIVGLGFDTMQEYRERILQADREKSDFVKVMFSGIMDFSGDGGVTGTPLEKDEIHEMIHIAHEEGFAVMAHVNGPEAVLHAVESGVDSVEHGNFMDDDCIHALAESHTVWVPTHVTISNLLRSSRFDHKVIHFLKDAQEENIKKAVSLGAAIALGSDAGAFCVPHAAGTIDEYHELVRIIGNAEGADRILMRGERIIKEKFCRKC